MSLKRKLILKALTDPKFRKLLEENPEVALSKEELEELKGGAGEVVGQINIIDIISKLIGPALFCVYFDDPF
jgi:hypothetical protein